LLLNTFAVLLLFLFFSSASFNGALLFSLNLKASLLSLSLLVQDLLLPLLLQLLILREHLRHFLLFKFTLPLSLHDFIQASLLKLTHFIGSMFFFLLKSFPCLSQRSSLFLFGLQYLLLLKEAPLLSLLSLLHLLLLNQL
jgi:hypothetical protein